MNDKERKGNVTATSSNSGAGGRKHGTIKQTTARRDNSGSAGHQTANHTSQGSAGHTTGTGASGSRKKTGSSSSGSMGSLITDAIGSAVGGKKLSASRKKKLRTIFIVAAVLLVLAFFAPKFTGKSSNLITLISEYLTQNNSDAAEVAGAIGSVTGIGSDSQSDSLLSQVAGALTGKSEDSGNALKDTEESDRTEAAESDTTGADVDDEVDTTGETDAGDKADTTGETDAGDKADTTVDAGNDSDAKLPQNAVQYRFRNNNLLKQHYEKHGIEMGFKSREEYEQAASDVINNPKALHKIEAEDGDEVYYIEETNEFVILSTDGFIRTYFLPSGGLDYYNRQ